MQKFFSNKKMIILLVSVIICIGLIAFSTSVRDKKSTPPWLQRFGNDVVSIIDRVFSGSAGGVRETIGLVSGLMDVYEENEHLKKQMDRLAEKEAEVDNLKNENKHLKAQLNVENTLSDYRKIHGTVISRAPDAWRETIIVNRGSKDGIKKNMAVLSGSGLIGRVIEVNKINSKVELLTASNQSSNRFSALVQNGKNQSANGVINGYDEDKSRLILKQLTPDAKIEKGQQVVTSGLGGVSPKGLLIGKVDEIKFDAFGLAQEVYIKPETNMEEIWFVTFVERLVEGD